MQAWVDELDNVLWAYRMMHRVPTGERPFNLTYGTQVASPLEIALPSPHVDNINLDTNE